ncbi:hypothetical protein CLV32_3040 [Pedobacter duraquae]|uniref:Uncharacterized protein n=1 Tax=Pedobacter duraquae TaxID=425511 RepID=A0A4R6IIW1_9SPHI|nr:hypothetical protein CLV32_3040 [Pedobacter duraquae]
MDNQDFKERELKVGQLTNSGDALHLKSTFDILTVRILSDQDSEPRTIHLEGNDLVFLRDYLNQHFETWKI